MKRRCILLAAIIIGVGCRQLRAAPAERPPEAGAGIQQDWLAEAAVRGTGVQAAAGIATSEDALGGCDGVKDGKWGFHTNVNASPSWWQVDLGKPATISRVEIYNRCETPDRTAKLQLLLSADGRTWTIAYRHDGSAFKGFTDKKPLVIALNRADARFVRVQIPAQTYLNLDEVEVYSADGRTNLALGQPADQSSVSPWSVRKVKLAAAAYPVAVAIDRGRKLAQDLPPTVNVAPTIRILDEIERDLKAGKDQESLYLAARRAVRKLAMANPVLDFDSVLFVKRAPGVYSHMSDQYYSWWSRPGGGVYLLEKFKSDSPNLKCLTAQFPEGSFLSPDLSYDGKTVLFAYCRHHPGRTAIRNKLDKESQPEDSFYHVFEMNVDGTGVRQITRGRYDDTFPRYLPSGEIVFLSTRRGQFFQTGRQSALATMRQTLPDSFVRCGGDAYRPVSIYTLHVMDGDGGDMRAISAFESFEWDPTVATDGRIYYARWDYVDRDNMPYMKLWSTNPDGTNPQAVFGNFTRNPHCIFEARSIPNSRKLLCTASGHHSITAGSLVLLDPGLGVADGDAPLKRLSTEVCFPESEGWPSTYFNSPYPLSEKYYLCAWSNQPMTREGNTFPNNAMGIYLYDIHGNLELLHRDPDISSMFPLPLKPRPAPVNIASSVTWGGPQEGRFFLQNVYDGLGGVPAGSIRKLRIVGMPVKVQPNMNSPLLGVTRDDPGKCVLGEVPVEADGSAHFRVPSGVSVFFQAIDEQGRAVQTMRSLTYVQPGQTLSCIGCHERRSTAPAANPRAVALMREPSKLQLGPEGSWPLRFDKLVQPVMESHCVSCHSPGSTDAKAARYDLTAAKAYDSLLKYGKPSLAEHVRNAYYAGKSVVHAGPSHTSPLLKLLTDEKGHYGVKLDADAMQRLVVWMDTYAQKQGHFSDEQERNLREFKQKVAEMLAKP